MAKLLTTKSNELVALLENANAGLWHFAYNVKHHKDAKGKNTGKGEIEWVSAGLANLQTDASEFLDKLYNPAYWERVKRGDAKPEDNSQRDYKLPDTPLTNFGAPLSITEDISDALIGVEDITYSNWDDKMPGSTRTYRDYATKELGVQFNLEDSDGGGNHNAASFLVQHDHAKHDPMSQLTKEETELYVPVLDDILYDSVTKGALSKKIDRSMQFNDSVLGYQNFLLIGPAGTGKSTVAVCKAKQYNRPIYTMVADKAMSFGEPFGDIQTDDDANSTKQWVTKLTKLLDACTRGWYVCIDEINNFTPDVQQVWNGVIAGQNRVINFRGKTYKVHPETVFFGTMNVGYQGNNPLNFAFASRWRKIYVESLVDEEYAKSFAKYLNFDEALSIKFCKFMFNLIQETAKTFQNQDQFSPDTPCFTIRDIPKVFLETFAAHTLGDTRPLFGVLGDMLLGILHGVSNPVETAKTFAAKYDKQIRDIEDAFFVSQELKKAAAAGRKKLMSIGVDQLTQKVQGAKSVEDSMKDLEAEESW
jgi:hypothetical protein